MQSCLTDHGHYMHLVHVYLSSLKPVISISENLSALRYLLGVSVCKLIAGYISVLDYIKCLTVMDHKPSASAFMWHLFEMRSHFSADALGLCLFPTDHSIWLRWVVHHLPLCAICDEFISCFLLLFAWNGRMYGHVVMSCLCLCPVGVECIAHVRPLSREWPFRAL